MPSFRNIQQQFTAAVRNPSDHNTLGIEPRRMSVYQELVFNNLINFTRSAFPVACSIMSSDWWQHAVRQFLIHHRSQSPYFNEIAAEFLSFLRESDAVTTTEPDFLLELMHYEWVELALDNIPQDTLAVRQQLSDDLVNGKPVLSDAAWLLSYEYPVHEISIEQQPTLQEKKDTLVLVYRKPDLSIGFRLMTPIFGLLWQQLQQKDISSGQDAIEQLAMQLGINADTSFHHHAQQALQELFEWGAILGAHNERT